MLSPFGLMPQGAPPPSSFETAALRPPQNNGGGASRPAFAKPASAGEGKEEKGQTEAVQKNPALLTSSLIRVIFRFSPFEGGKLRNLSLRNGQIAGGRMMTNAYVCLHSFTVFFRRRPARRGSTPCDRWRFRPGAGGDAVACRGFPPLAPAGENRQTRAAPGSGAVGSP